MLSLLPPSARSEVTVNEMKREMEKHNWKKEYIPFLCCQLLPATGHSQGRKRKLNIEPSSKYYPLHATGLLNYWLEDLTLSGWPENLPDFSSGCLRKANLYRLKGTARGKASVHDSMPRSCLCSVMVTESAYWWLLYQERYHGCGKEQR